MTKTASPLILLSILIGLLHWRGLVTATEADFIFKPPNQDSPNILFAESFLSSDALERFIPSKASKEGVDEEIAKYDGHWEVAPVEASGLQGDLSLIMKDRAKHHAIAAELTKPFKPGSKPLVFQYEVKFQTENSCGGAYVKLLSKTPVDAEGDFTKFHDKTPYTIMFGPDRCGTQEKFHFILRHVHPVTGGIEEKHAKKPSGFSNKHFEVGKTRLYRLVVHPDSSFEMSVDREVLSKGHLLSDMSPAIIPEEMIDDAADVKPEDWDDREKIPDPEAVKPDDWDEAAPKQIEDPAAMKPEGWLDGEEPTVPDVMAERPADWDDEMDGEWEAPLVENPRCKDAPGCGAWSPPLIDNPAYKGIWRPALIENPQYKGIWKPRKIKNPEYFEEVNPFERITPIAAIGLELWTMSENVAFDNFIVADDVGVVDRWTDETWAVKHAKEGATAPSGPTVLHQLFDAANERPWLWIVYMIALLIPICVMTMIFCPVKKDKTETNDDGKAGQYDSIRDETREEEALRKKTDDPIPDVIEEEQEEERAVVEEPAVVEELVKDAEPAQQTTPVKETVAMQRPEEEEEALPTTPVKMSNGVDHAETNGVHAENEDDVDETAPLLTGKSVLNGISDEDEILRRSPRLKSKTRARKE